MGRLQDEDYDLNDETETQSGYVYIGGYALRVVEPEFFKLIPEEFEDTSYHFEEHGVVPFSSLEERMNKDLDLNSDKIAAYLAYHHPWVRTWDDLQELKEKDWAFHQIIEHYKITVENGHVISRHEPRTGILYGNWQTDPTPDAVHRRRKAADFTAENLIDWWNKEGRRNRPFTGGGHDEDEVPWNENTLVDPWGQTSIEFTREKMFGTEVDMYHATSNVYPSRDKNCKIMAFVVMDEAGNMVEAFFDNNLTPNGEARAHELANDINGFVVHKPVELNATASFDPRPFKSSVIGKITTKKFLHERISIENPRWWLICDDNKHAISRAKPVPRRKNSGFFELGWNFKENDWNDAEARDYLLHTIRIDVDAENVQVCALDTTPWGSKQVLIYYPIPQEWLENNKNTRFCARFPNMKYFLITVKGPQMVVEDLIDGHLKEVKKLNVIFGSLNFSEIQSEKTYESVPVVPRPRKGESYKKFFRRFVSTFSKTSTQRATHALDMAYELTIFEETNDAKITMESFLPSQAFKASMIFARYQRQGRRTGRTFIMELCATDVYCAFTDPHNSLLRTKTKWVRLPNKKRKLVLADGTRVAQSGNQDITG